MPLLNRTNIFGTEIQAARWTRDALRTSDTRCPRSVILETDFYHSLSGLSFEGLPRNRGNIPLFHEHVCNAQLEIRVWDVHERLPRASRIPQTHKHIRNGIGDYHDDLVTPGIFPSLANSRKQIRQRSKSRMCPRRRPHLKQRFTARTANFGFFWRAIVDFFAM